MDVLAIILACSLHPDDELVRTLIDVQSNRNAYFVGDLSTLKTNDSLETPTDALRFAEDLRRHGGRPAVGLLGVPLEWAQRYGRAPIELFDACTNVAVATAAFAGYARQCSPAHLHPRRGLASTKLRRCILSRFARDLGLGSSPSVILERVFAGRGAPSAVTADAPPERSLIFVEGWEGDSSRPAASAGPGLFVDPLPKAPDSR
jgi:hypothetical protein